MHQLSRGWNLSSLCKLRRLREAVHRLGFLNHDSIAICSENYACVLRECVRSGASAEGKQLHSYILQSGLNVVKFPPVQHLSLIKKPIKSRKL